LLQRLLEDATGIRRTQQGSVGSAPADVFRNLARRVAIATILFLLTIELVGAAILTFFGISLPVVQLAGGFVLAGMGWGLLNDKDEGKAAKQTAAVERWKKNSLIRCPSRSPPAPVVSWSC
jgi:small neutral amino acid transporter SnatA (MarC family)